ncbi:MAG: hypothetical protein AAGF97_15790, partial [Planctomycetota bacterium]
GTAVGYANPIPTQVAQTNGWPSTAPAAAAYPPPQVASQPLPIRGPGYGEPVGGETVYIPPHADPYLAAATGPTSTSSVGWQRRD